MGSRPLYSLFTQVTPHYDLLNRLLTVGMDQRWRQRAASACLFRRPARVLDVCCGTADLALIVADRSDSATEIVAVDFSETMIAAAQRKVSDKGYADRLSLILTDLAELPFPDGYFDAIGIAFAFRNITFENPRRARYLSEIHRVLAPEGRFVIAETSQPRSSLLRVLFHQYMKRWSAPLGGVVSGHRGAYRFLSLSAQRFLHPDGVVRLLEASGFGRVEFSPLMGGVAGIHVARRWSRETIED
jgi:demethylmenaquinone methyltransferase/2-methoxy-6-polyprenyl-1,4-benzoquinol methylase